MGTLKDGRALGTNDVNGPEIHFGQHCVSQGEGLNRDGDLVPTWVEQRCGRVPCS